MRRVSKAEAGAVFSELALSLPILFLVIHTMTTLGNLSDHANIASVATRHGARTIAEAAWNERSEAVCDVSLMEESKICRSGGRATTLLERGLRSTCDYFEDQGVSLDWRVSAKIDLHSEGGEQFRVVTVTAQTEVNEDCLFCLGSLFRASHVRKQSAFAVEKRCS